VFGIERAENVRPDREMLLLVRLLSPSMLILQGC